MEKKVAHLQLIQGVINRMASNSFQVKGWSVVLVSALLALASKDAPRVLVYLAFLPVVVFWPLDAYFLWQERLFRRLYDSVRALNEDAIDFAMNTDVAGRDVPTWLGAMFSITLVVFHGMLIAAVGSAAFVLTRFSG